MSWLANPIDSFTKKVCMKKKHTSLKKLSFGKTAIVSLTGTGKVKGGSWVSGCAACNQKSIVIYDCHGDSFEACTFQTRFMDCLA